MCTKIVLFVDEDEGNAYIYSDEPNIEIIKVYSNWWESPDYRLAYADAIPTSELFDFDAPIIDDYEKQYGSITSLHEVLAELNESGIYPEIQKGK